jgi:hypothetical protein
MSDFIVPYPPFRDRRSAPNGFGFRTILGNASPLSPQWDYARERAAEDNDAGFRGAPNVEPPPDSPEFQAAEAAAFPDAPPQPTAASAAAAALGASEAAKWALPEQAAALAARAAPLAPAAAPPVAAALPFIALPTFNSDGQTVSLGDRFRARQPPGQRSVIIERRVADGLLGTSVGAKWEELPSLDATLRVGQYGLKTLFVDANQLRSTLGADAAKQLFATGLVIDRQAAAIDEATNRSRTALPPQPLSVPPTSEMRIGVSLNGGEKVETREATAEEVQRLCPTYPEYVRLGTKISETLKALGWVNGPPLGTRAHKLFADILKMQNIEAELQKRGVFQREPEFALREGQPKSYSKGFFKLDVLELYKDYATVCVFDLKTGGATISQERIYDLMRNANIYAKSKEFGYPNVYFIPIHVR